MRILQLCKKFPYPLLDGESIAISYLSKAMNRLGCEVTLLAMNTSKHRVAYDDTPESLQHYKAIYSTEVDNQVKVWGAFKNLFSSDSYHISRFESKEFEAQLISLLEKETFDIIQLETLYLTPYIPIIRKYSKALICMRAHNIESEIWQRITKNTSFLPKRVYLNHLTEKLKTYELNHLNDYDYLVTVSNRDLKQFKKLGYKNGALASPIGLELNGYNSAINPFATKDICFIGSLDWRPNMEGISWFVDNVMPLVREFVPPVHLHIAGRNNPEAASKLKGEQVHFHGEVPSAIDFINDHKIMVVPLFSGSGTRVKILEGLALGKIIVTTTVGLEGIEAEHKKHVMIADTPEDFVSAIKEILSDEDLSGRLIANGKAFVKKYYDNLENAKVLIAKYKEIQKSPAYQK